MNGRMQNKGRIGCLRSYAISFYIVRHSCGKNRGAFDHRREASTPFWRDVEGSCLYMMLHILFDSGSVPRHGQKRTRCMRSKWAGNVPDGCGMSSATHCWRQGNLRYHCAHPLPTHIWLLLLETFFSIQARACQIFLSFGLLFWDREGQF